MIQRDLKIGLVLGLVIVAGLVLKLAIDPRLSAEARMKDIIASKDIQDNNNYLDEVLNEAPFNPYSEALYEEPEDLQYEEPVIEDEPVIEVAEQYNNENNYPALQQQFPPAQTPPPIQPSIEIPEPSYVEEEIVNEPEVIVEPEVEVVKEPQRFHVIEKDQTLSSISKLYYGSPNKWQIIVDANPDVIKNPNKIKPGMKIVIP